MNFRAVAADSYTRKGLEIRQQIDAHLEAGEFTAAQAALGALWRTDPSSATANFVVSRFEQIAPSLALISHRLAILRSFTVEPVIPLLRAAAFCAGVHLTVRLGEFNAWRQELLDPSGWLVGFVSQTVFLATQTRDAAPAETLNNLRAGINAFRERSTANIVIHNFAPPTDAPGGLLDAQQLSPAVEANVALVSWARTQNGVYVLDYDALTARHGRRAWHDERKWLTVRQPIAALYLQPLALEWMRFLHPLTGKLAKVCVVDLDHTLWGGVIGEDGLAGIQVSSEYPGAAFQDLQRALLALRERGILLAIASKNNAADALEALDHHPGMLLRREHFAAMEIHWGPKAESLRAIARTLNVGLDALAFVDDNPVERQQIRQELPEVTVLELPVQPMLYAQTIRECPFFERLVLSEEDRRRASLYQAEQDRKVAAAGAASPAEFLASLNQRAEITLVTPLTLARAAQLTQKTNQFNLTTRRYSETELTALAERPGWNVWTIRVEDRYADNGLVGVAITNIVDDVCEIDTFLLSCRVISRGVETALLSQLATAARRFGCSRLSGWYLPTRKNEPSREFYANHGFVCAKQTPEGSYWEIDLEQSAVASPAWIEILAPAEMLT